mmetsp:Transcript_27998/g.56395  ORF Transcript_27998/g.56395 Transcript_27998/m.56395 type:complete len:190 (+) Transcript_27998:50-619(+)
MSTNSRATLLLHQQLKELNKKPSDLFSAGLADDSNIFDWDICITGPQDTLYEGGIFNCKMIFPPTYPERPPKMKFVTPIWHPNGPDIQHSLHWCCTELTTVAMAVYPNGDVCISILHEPGEDATNPQESASMRWNPCHTVETVVISVISMLSDPTDESPANLDAAKEFRDDYPAFKKKVARCVARSQDY